MNHSEQLSVCIMFFDEAATVRAHVSEAISQKPLIFTTATQQVVPF